MKNLLTLLLLCMSIIAFSQDFTIENFDVDLRINKDGSLSITENIEVVFHKKRRGIFRNIPYSYSFEGSKVKLNITDISVSGHDYKVSTKGRDKVIRIGHPDQYLSGKVDYNITYTAEYPIIQHETYQELYWNATGTDWDTDIENASLKVTLPTDLALANNDVNIWVGKGGSQEVKGTISQEDITTVTARSQETLKSGEGMTIALKMPYDFLDIPAEATINSQSSGSQKMPLREHNKPWWLALPLGIIAFIGLKWKEMRSRTPDPDFNKKYSYYPPDGLTSAHVGTFIDHKSNKRDVISLIPYWAAEGFISISYNEGIFLHKRKDLPDHYPDYEKSFFGNIFSESDVVDTSTSEGSFLSDVSSVSTSLEKEIKYQEYYDEQYHNIFRSWKTIAAIILTLVAGCTCMALGMFWLGGGLLAMFLLLTIMGLYAPVLTPKGKSLMAQLKAFERFLKDSPREELSQVMASDPRYFDKMLPFAIAFGIDKAWIKSIEPFMAQSPDWYHGSERGFGYFATTFDSKSVTTSFTQAPQNVSSGGGFSGGGSVGGGFGGGGGGSW